MQIFYTSSINGNSALLDENESAHCIRVLRMKKKDTVFLVDGKGNLFEGYIEDPDPRGCNITITGRMPDFEKRNYRLHVAISPLKNHERFEWFIEKSVELGVDEITPVICSNTEKPGIKSDRINNLIISAMKQSVKAFRPALCSTISFNEFLEKDIKGCRMIAHCDRQQERSRISQVYNKGNDAVILIGPEGDFTRDEIASAIFRGFIPVHLGPCRLRTETAGVAACHSVYFINQ